MLKIATNMRTNICIIRRTSIVKATSILGRSEKRYRRFVQSIFVELRRATHEEREADRRVLFSLEYDIVFRPPKIRKVEGRSRSSNRSSRRKASLKPLGAWNIWAKSKEEDAGIQHRRKITEKLEI